ncbi:hypothetical protein B0H13DRAFT_2459774 [Mycena leptocephala]|nr:hypothetical protein B0H13DRAFT_2459774 [Mycena leptocephala]
MGRRSQYGIQSSILHVIDEEDMMVSPGIVEAHSNLGVYSVPAFECLRFSEIMHIIILTQSICDEQDAFCARGGTGLWDGMTFPGQLALPVHWYEAVDLDQLIRFPIAVFRHTGETYLVADLLMKAWVGSARVFIPLFALMPRCLLGNIPAIALLRRISEQSAKRAAALSSPPGI